MYSKGDVVSITEDIRCDCCNNIIMAGNKLNILGLVNKRKKLYMVSYDIKGINCIHRIKLSVKNSLGV